MYEIRDNLKAAVIVPQIYNCMMEHVSTPVVDFPDEWYKEEEVDMTFLDDFFMENDNVVRDAGYDSFDELFGCNDSDIESDFQDLMISLSKPLEEEKVSTYEEVKHTIPSIKHKTAKKLAARIEKIEDEGEKNLKIRKERANFFKSKAGAKKKKRAVLRHQARTTRRTVEDSRRKSTKQRVQQQLTLTGNVTEYAGFESEFAKVQRQRERKVQPTAWKSHRRQRRSKRISNLSSKPKKGENARQRRTRLRKEKQMNLVTEALTEETKDSSYVDFAGEDYIEDEEFFNSMKNALQSIIQDPAYEGALESSGLYKMMKDNASTILDGLCLLYLSRPINTPHGFVRQPTSNLVIMWFQFLARYTGITMEAILDLYEVVRDFISSLWCHEYETESMGDFVELVMNASVNSTIMNSLYKMFSALLTIIAPGWAIDKLVKSFLGRSTKGLLSIFMEGVSAIGAIYTSIRDGTSLWDLFVTGDDITQLHNDMRYIIDYGELTYRCVAVPGKVSFREYLLKCRSVEKRMNTMKISRFHTKYGAIESMRMRVSSCIANAESENHGTNRTTPFALLLTGMPGIGKSVITKLISQLWMNIKGEEFTQDAVYSRVSSSEYWEGYGLHTPIVHISEIGNKNKALAKTQGDSVINELLSVVDSLPMRANMANVDAKGKIFIAPDMVIADTNNEEFNAKYLFEKPSAILRRFKVLRLVLKEEYCKQGSCELDPTKTEGNLDLYRWTIIEKRAVDERQVNESIIAAGSTTHGMLVSLGKLMCGHLDKMQYVSSDDFNDNLGNTVSLAVDELFGESKDEKEDLDQSPYEIFEQKHFTSVMDEVLQTEALCDHMSYNSMAYLREYAPAYIKSTALNYLSDCCESSEQPIISGMLFFLGLFFLFLHFYSGLAMIACSISLKQIIKRILNYLTSMLGMDVQRIYRWTRYSNARVALLKSYMDGKCMRVQTVLRDHALLAGTITASVVVGLMVMIYKIMKKNQRYTEAASAFERESEYNVGLNELEEKTGASVAQYRAKASVHDHWNTQQRPMSTPVATGDLGQFYGSINDRSYYMRITHGDYSRFTHGLFVTTGVCVVNTHALGNYNDYFTLRIYHTDSSDSYNEYTVYSAKTYDGGNDVTFLTIPRSARDITQHFSKDTPSVNCHGVWNGESVRLVKKQNIKVYDKHFGDIILADAVHYQHPKHQPGLCGTPVIATLGKHHFIYGIHTAGGVDNDNCVAVPITQDMISDAVFHFANKGEFILNDLTTQSYEAPVRKSVMRYIPVKHLVYYGKTPGCVMVQKKHHFIDNPLQVCIPDIMKYLPEYNRNIGPADFSSGMRNGEWHSPDTAALKKMDVDVTLLDPLILDRIVDEYTQYIIENLDDKVWMPYTITEVINGGEADAYLRRVNVKAAAGIGLTGTKEKHLPLVDEEKHVREPSNELKLQLFKQLQTYVNGDMDRQAFKVCFKPEIRPIGKPARAFYAGQTKQLILHKAYLGPLYTSMCEQSAAYCCSLGIDMHKETDEFMRTLREFSDLFLEGDYSGYDVSLPFSIANAAARVTYNIFKHKGYNDTALKVVYSILTENLYPLVSMYNDCLDRPGMQPSGKYGTAEDNSLRGVLCMMYVWYNTPVVQDLSFFEHVLPRVYGDDVVAAIRPVVIDDFNNQIYQSGCAKHLRMKFTAADKGIDMTKYLLWNEISFLKRTFYFESDKYYSKIDSTTIYKMLRWYEPSSSLSECDQLMSICTSLLYEVFFHVDKEAYFDIYTILCDFFRHNYNVNPNFCTYANLYSKLKSFDDSECEEEYKEDEDPIVYLQTESNQGKTKVCLGGISALQSENPHLTVHDECALDMEPIIWRAEELNKEIVAMLEELRFQSKILLNEGIYSRREMSKKTDQLEAKYKRSVEYYDTQATIGRLTRSLNKKDLLGYDEKYETESAEMKSNVMPNVTYVQNFVEEEGENKEYVNVASEPYPLNIGQQERLELDDFFSRPIEISNYEIAVDSASEVVIAPMDAYLLEQAVRAKLKNYAYIRADLNMRIVVSASPFHASQMLVSYQPYAVRNRTLGAYDTLEAVVPIRKLRLNYLSQTKYKAYINVNENEPVEMCVPFTSFKPSLRLYNSSSLAISDVASFEDAADYGNLYLYTINPVRADAGASAVKVQVYAFLTNVSLGCTTGTQLQLVTESLDERDVGPIEDIASKTIDYAKSLSTTPIAPLAEPTIPALTTVKNVAAVMGWSTPSIPRNKVMMTVPMPIQNGANSIGVYTGKRITIDPKQQLSLEPRLVGDEHDVLNIMDIASKETYLTTFNWTVANTAMTPIFNCAVTPQLVTWNSVLNTYCQPTPMGWLANMFEYWRGDIQFRFEFVTTRYDRGKALFMYEPNIAQSTLINSDIALNKQFMHVIDLQNDQSITLNVEWAAARSWLRCLPQSTQVQNYTPSFSPTATRGTGINGYISVMPFTGLTNNDSASVEVNVYVSSPNLRLAVPSSRLMPTGRLETESGEAENIQYATSLNMTGATQENISKHHFGEEVFTLRSLIHRYVTRDITTQAVGIGGDMVLNYVAPIYPTPFPLYGDTNVDPYVLGEIMYAFLGFRGGIRHRLYMSNQAYNVGPTTRTLVKLNDPAVTTALTSLSWDTALVRTPQIGGVNFIPRTNGGIEFETPCYNQNLYLFSFADDWVGNGNSVNELDDFFIRDFTASFEAGSALGPNHVIHDWAVGEDFTFFHFSGAPYYSY